MLAWQGHPDYSVASGLHSGGSSKPSPDFIELLRQHSLSVLDRQLRLDQLAGEADWWISQDSGTLTLGDLVGDIQFIGSESDKPHEWLWAWANENVDPPLSASAQRLRVAWEHVMELARDRCATGADALPFGHVDRP